MDVFSRTFLPAAAEAGVAVPTANRHMQMLRRCVEPDDTTVLVTRCARPGRLRRGNFLLLLTQRRLVVIYQNRFLRHLRLHLNADLRHLSSVSWNSDVRTSDVILAATAVDGVREQFCMRAAHPEQVWHLEDLLGKVFRRRGGSRLAAAA